MTRIKFDWPDAAAERVRAAEGRLRVAGEALRARSFDDRLRAVAELLDDWTRADSPWRRELAQALTHATPFTGPTLEEGLDSALRAWRPEDFVACAQREIGASLSGGRRLAPFDWTTVIAGGALPMPTLLSSLLPLVLGSPVLLRQTTKDPVTGGMIARSLAARDEDLGRAFEPIDFSSDDAAAMTAALAAPCVVATGSDETLASITSRLSPSQRFVGYGHRFSIGVVGPNLDADGRKRVAAGLALDVARWDQGGCLSPVVVYLVDFDDAAARRFASEVADALARTSADLPRGELAPETKVAIANERSSARMRLGDEDGMLFDGDDYTVVLEPDAQARPAPLGRFLRLMCVDSVASLNRALEPFSGHLSNVCLEGFAPSGKHSASGSMRRQDESFWTDWRRLGISRVTGAGRLQTPPVDWPHDGLPLFVPVARFASAAGSRTNK